MSYPTQGYLYQVWNTGKWNYSAPSGYAGPVTLAYRVYDGQAYSNTASVAIDVTRAMLNGDYGAYLSAIDSANQTYRTAVLGATAARDAEIGAALVDGQAQANAAYQTYLDAATTAFSTVKAELQSAIAEYDATVDPAVAALQTATAGAMAALEYGVAGAVLNRDLAVSDAKGAYADAVTAADTAYDSAVGPYQEARDGAFAAYQTDPDLYDAWQQSETDLSSAIAAASSARSNAYSQAAANRNLAIAQADATSSYALAAVLNAYTTTLSDALNQFTQVESNARQVFQNRAWPTRYTYFQAEYNAWIAYQQALQQIEGQYYNRVAMAHMQHASALGQTSAAWGQAEQEAWADYYESLEPNEMPEARITSPPAVDIPPPPGSIVRGQSDPQNFSGQLALFQLPTNLHPQVIITRVMIQAGRYVVNRAAFNIGIASIRQDIMAAITNNPRGEFQYGGAVRTLADSLGGVDLDAFAERVKADLVAEGFTGVAIGNPIANVRFAVHQPERNPRSGFVTFVAMFRVRLTAVPPGGGAAINMELSAAMIVGEFRDGNLERRLLQP